MKKFFAAVLPFLLAISLVACTDTQKSEAEKAQEAYERAKQTQEALEENERRAQEELDNVMDMFDEYNRLQDALNP